MSDRALKASPDLRRVSKTESHPSCSSNDKHGRIFGKLASQGEAARFDKAGQRWHAEILIMGHDALGNKEKPLAA